MSTHRMQNSAAAAGTRCVMDVYAFSTHWIMHGIHARVSSVRYVKPRAALVFLHSFVHGGSNFRGLGLGN